MSTAKLIVNPTSSARREISLARTLISIGRDPSNDIVLPDAMVSRRHAVIEYRGSQYYLRDCNSSNGSLVNGDRISERNLRDGDLVAIGTARLLFRDEPQLEEAGPKVVPHPSSPKLVCPACRADFRKGDAFCRQCGAPVSPGAPPKLVCASCGTVVPLPARFCNACGAALGSKERAEEARPRRASGEAGALAPFAATLPPVDPADVSLPQAPPLLARDVPTPSPPSRLSGAPNAAGSSHKTEPAPLTPARAGLGARLAAGLIDLVVVGLVQGAVLAPVLAAWRGREPASGVPALSLALSLAAVAAATLAAAAYFVYFWGVKGATPGKRLLGLVLERTDGRRPIGIRCALLRLLGYLLSGTLLGAGFLMAAFGGRALHDRIAGTRVVRGRV